MSGTKAEPHVRIGLTDDRSCATPLTPPPQSPFPTPLLLSWYDANHRTLPWRGTRDPYRVWISEVMCQQTRVTTVLGYYERWMERFPDVRALADSEEDEVFVIWQGLGYYSRARNVLLAARTIVGDFDGDFPANAAGLRALPGIGRYTAAAIASIAYDEPVGVVDGNVLRLLSRFFAIADDISQPRTRKTFWPLADAAIDDRRPGDSNQAMMELGALICTPRSPKCDRCPLFDSCAARRDGTTDVLPFKSPKRPPRYEHRFAYRLERRDGAVLVARNPSGTLLGGLWHFPMLPADGDPITAFSKASGHVLDDAEVFPPMRHVFTHIRMEVTLVSAHSNNVENIQASEELRWIAPDDLAAVGTSTLMKKLLAHHNSAPHSS